MSLLDINYDAHCEFFSVSCHRLLADYNNHRNLPSGTIVRALERGGQCRVSTSNILQFRVSTWKSQCRVSSWYNYYILVVFTSIFLSFGRWVSSVGVNFECRCRAFFSLNVGCRMKNFGNVGCRNNPFHGPYSWFSHKLLPKETIQNM